jgi:EAL domain-containing protein (putative c-di-GMP-specific phosphodiesterase class I)/GGDEF domain-containing protein
MSELPDLSATMPPFRRAGTEAPQGEQEIARADLRGYLTTAVDHARFGKRAVAMLVISLMRPDRLDAMTGVATADIMRRVLKRLPTVLRGVDRFTQISDEKLCLMLPNLQNVVQATLAANKVSQMLESPFSFGERITTVRPVIGIASFPDHADNADDLMLHADVARKIARARDLTQHTFQREDRAQAEVFLGLDGELREAIRASQLEVHYQPLWDLHKNECHGVEALLRWTTPERGAIPPPAIIRVAEANGMIGALTSWILNTVLRHQSEWKKLGVRLPVSVNLSAVSLTDGDLPDVIAQTLGTWNAIPADLTMEITESSTIGDMEHSLAILQRLKSFGLRLSVDDFGTGYSSLSYVKRFPLDELKIDRLFVQHMRQSKGDQQIVRSLIDLAHHFDMQVVAEGIEDVATAEDLKSYGCDIGQGYVFSRALPSAELLRWLK